MSDLSGEATVGGTAQTIASFDPRRRYLSFQNLSSEDIWIAFGATAVADRPSYKVESGLSAEWGSEAKEMICRSISVIAATTGSEWSAHDSVN